MKDNKRKNTVINTSNNEINILLLFLISTFLFTFKAYSNENGLNNVSGKTVKILPLGNSITFDNRENDERNIGQKAGYRYPLYLMLKSAGYNFDFIGSEHSGGSFLPAGYDENAGFPGITDDQLLYLLQTGRLIQLAQGIDRQITAGSYLNTYSPDLILLHIGTNNNEIPGGTSPLEVEQILDEIDQFETQSGKSVTVILARIIDRVPNESFVTEFNNNIESMALDRVNNPGNDAYPDNIVIVDMEDSAKINYIISPDPNGTPGDMNDSAHPNTSGYSKMAQQWFNAITSVLPNPPIIIIDPTDQYTIEGNSVTFNLVAEGEGSISYQWKKNGSNIPFANKSELKLTSVNIIDNNNIYSCLVTNDNGSVISKPAKLIVNNINSRILNSKIAEYDFEEGEGNSISNLLGNEELNLKINDQGSVEWVENGIKLINSSNISTENAANIISDSIIGTNLYSFELWLETEELSQTGPARILTLSNNASERNFTLGQNLDHFVIRTRTTETNNDGIPDYQTENGFVSNELTHVTVTRNGLGEQRIYINGSISDSVLIEGNLSNWNNNYKLAIGNEIQANNPWIGSIYYLAIYNRNLTKTEIAHNYTLGESGITSFENNLPNYKRYFELYQNYPNPFNPSTKINFDIPEASKVSLTIYNMLGQQVMKVFDKEFSAGRYNYNFDGSNLTSGIYIYTITASGTSGNNFTQSRKMILLK